MMQSERIASLGTLCANSKADVAVLTVTEPLKEVGTLGQAFMGRSHHEINGKGYVAACSNPKKVETFLFLVKLETGQYAGQTTKEIHVELNKEYAHQMLQAIGK